MKYECNLTLDIPRERVIELFDSRDNLFEWQEGLVSFDHASGTPGQVGAVSNLKYKMGKREIEMTETIVLRDTPDAFHGIYEADGVWNKIENFFTELDGGRTHWRLTSEFRCKGFLRVMAFLFPGMFKKQTVKFMNDFKTFAEGASASA